jgi:hypothetical protein
MAVGDEITAARFNLLQGRIATILGIGAGDSGYGQSLTSSQVSVGAEIRASNLNAIYTDIVRARVHQIGSVPASIVQVAIGDIIAEDTSTNPNGILKGFTDYENTMSTVESNKFAIAGSQSTSAVGITSTRTSVWNSVIIHEVSVSFTDANQARYFFNSGGEIRFSANIVGGSGAKTLDWTTILQNMGTIKMNYTDTTTTGLGTDSSIGFYDLTSSYQTIFTRDGTGLYSNNQYKVEAFRATSNVIRFRITFNDGTSGTNDEDVNGTLTSTVGLLRATGSFVSVNAPIFGNIATL